MAQNDLLNKIPQIIDSSDITVGLSDVAKASKVSSTQIRYWTKKGYLKSKKSPKNQETSTKFPIVSIINARLIKHYLDEGYTLTASVNHMKKHQTSVKNFRDALFKRIKDIEKKDHKTIINLGTFEPNPHKNIFLQINSGKATFFLQSKRANIS